LVRIFVDADACPVKDEVYRVAARHELPVWVVANQRISVPRSPRIEMKVVSGKFDAADDWIVEQLAAGDIAITSDLLLASRALKQGAQVLDPKGRVFTDDNIGDVLASREISAFLRDMGAGGGGPAPYGPRDRSRFLQVLENLIQAARKLDGSKRISPA
jgi:uncharacterized protein YaiI (UPF0178 family)